MILSWQWKILSHQGLLQAILVGPVFLKKNFLFLRKKWSAEGLPKKERLHDITGSHSEVWHPISYWLLEDSIYEKQKTE